MIRQALYVEGETRREMRGANVAVSLIRRSHLSTADLLSFAMDVDLTCGDTSIEVFGEDCEKLGACMYHTWEEKETAMLMPGG